MTINFIKRKSFTKTAWKTLNVIVGVSTILNVSLVGALVAPQAANAAIQYTLEGQRKDDLSFTPGNICSGGGACYAEGENVPFRLTITDLTPSTTYSVRIQHDFQDSAGRDGYVNFNTPGTWDGSATGVGLSAPTTSAGLPNTKTYDLTFTTASATTVVQLQWFGLLGQNAGEWNGAQLHARLVQGVQQESIGNKEVPIQVTKIVIRNLSVTKSDNPDPIQLNSTTTYTILITNSGEQDETVTVVDQLPSKLVYVNGSGNPAPSSVSGDSRTITWNGIVVTKDGGTRTLTFNARGVEVGIGTNTVTVTAPLLDPVSDTENTTVLGQCELTITKSVNKQTAQPGETLTYTIDYANTGTANCTGGGVRIDDVTPSNTTYVNDSNTQQVSNDTDSQGIGFGYAHAVFGSPNPAGYDPVTKLLSWDGEVVSPGESGRVTYQVTVNQLPVCTTTNIDNTAKIYAEQIPSGITSNNVRTTVTTQCNGHLIIDKVTNPSGDSKLFSFDASGGSYADFTLTDAQAPNNQDLVAGTYSVSEIVPAGWDQTSATCSDGSPVTAIVLSAEETVTCTFTNTKLGSITVEKQTSPANDTDTFTFTGDAAGTIGDNGTIIVPNLLPGTYSSTEGLNGNYTLSSIVCSDTNSTENTETRTASFNVSAGENVTCIFTNTRNQGTIELQKNFIGATENVTIKIGTSQGGLQTDSATLSADGTTGENTVYTGSYFVSETLTTPANYTSNLDCFNDIDHSDTINTGDTSHAVNTDTGEVTVGNNDDVICRFTNTRKTGDLTVTKVVINDNGGTKVVADFPLFVNATPVTSGVQNGFNAGQYTVSETNQTGYTATISGDCAANGSITLNPGDVKECTITNNDIQPKLTVTKVVVNDNGGTKQVADFPLFVDVTPVTSGVQNGFNAGAYTVSETPQFGYTASVNGDCAPNGSITLNPGDVKSCTITNNDIQPQLTVVKLIIDDFGGGAIPSNFTMHVDGENASPSSFPGSDSGTLVLLDEGDYDVFEDNVAGYDPVFSADCSGTIEVGEEKTCVVTNNALAPHLVVIKHVIIDNGGTKEAADFTMNVTGTDVVPASFAGDENGTLVSLDIGPYSVDESGPPGYTKSLSADCSGSIALGETKTCTITNDDIAPTITLVKQVINNNGGEAGPNDFGLTIGGTPVDSGQTLAVNANTPIALDEDGLPGYQFVSMTDDEDEEYDEGGDGVCPSDLGDTVTLDEGQNITCVITNDDIAPLLTVTKVVINDNGGTKVVADFPLFVDVTPVTSGVQNGFNAGQYTVSETNQIGYTATISGDCAANGSITLNPGDVKECTITNNDIQPKLTVTKVVINDNGGTKVVADFPLFVDVTPVTSGVQNGFNAGQHTVSETNQPGYTATITGDCSESGSIALNPGDVKSCTITNNDQAAHLIVVKHVVNNDGGIKTAADFTLTINGVTVPSGASFAGAEAPGVDKPVFPGTYSVTESAVIGYATSFSSDCSGTIALGETKTCTVTNDDIKPVIAVDKQGPATVNAGENISYTIAWSVSAAPVTNAVISDTIPTNTSFVSAGCGTTTGTCVVNSATSTITWNLGSRNPGESGTVTLTVKSNSPLTNGTVITNTATFDADQTDPVSDTVTTTVSSLPVLGIQKSANPTTVPAGQNVTWTVKWSVAGNASATNVVIVDPIPANSAFVSVADAGVYDAVTNKITWNLGTQSPGASGEVHYVVKTASPIANNTVITNTATIDSAETDPAISASASVTVTSAPDLTITKVTDVQTFTNPGKAITYTVTVTNKATATDTARNVVLTDTLPTGFTFAVDGTTTKSFTIGNLTPGQSATITYLVNISGTQAAGTFNNSAKAKGDNTNEVSAVAPVEVRVPIVLGIEALPDLTIEKTASKATAKPGDVITYSITVRNTGDADANNVVITDTLPKDLSFVHAKGRAMTWDIGTLEPGRSREMNVDVRVESDAKKGDYVNVATVAADDVPQKETQEKITVRVPKVLGLAKTGPGALDLMIAFIGITLIALGVLGLRRRGAS